MKVTIELKLYDGTWIPITIVSMVPFRSWNSLVNSQMDILKLNDEEIRTDGVTKWSGPCVRSHLKVSI